MHNLANKHSNNSKSQIRSNPTKNQIIYKIEFITKYTNSNIIYNIHYKFCRVLMTADLE